MPPRRSLREQLRAAVSSPIDRVVFKATDNTAARPKQKHVEHLIHLSYHEHFDAQEYVAILRRRYEAPTSTGLTMAKALALTHSLMNNSSQRLYQCMATEAPLFRAQPERLPESFLRQYGEFLDQRLLNYVRMAEDPFRKSTRLTRPNFEAEIEDGQAQTFPLLTTTLELAEHLVACEAVFVSISSDLNQYIAKMLLRDLREILVPLVDMYAVVAERFFQQPKMRAQKLLVLYKRFSSVCTRADGFLEACTRAQLLAGSGNMAQLAAGPTKLLSLMEHHVSQYYQRVSSRKGNQKSASSVSSSEPSHSVTTPFDVEQFQDQAGT